LVEEGDEIVIDAEGRRIDLAVGDAELAARRDRWAAPEPRYETGALAKYARLVSSADHGAVTS
jgi:dihydroxy-acid dehydratase